MAGPRKKNAAKKKKSPALPAKAPALTDDDASALDEFCKEIDCSEIDYASWESSHSSLDLQVLLFLSAADAKAGGDRPVSFCRTSRKAPDAPPTREKAQCLVPLPPQLEHGHKIVLKGQGDVVCGRFGDLIVVVHVQPKSSS